MKTQTKKNYKPAMLNPDQYQYVGSIDRRRYTSYNETSLGVSSMVDIWVPITGTFTYDPDRRGYYEPNRGELRAWLAANGGVKDNFDSKHGCDCCGNNSWKDGCLFRNTVTGELIVVGYICAGEKFDLSQAEYDRKRAEQSRKSALSRAQGRKYLAENPGVFAAIWAAQVEIIRYTDENRKNHFTKSASIITDIWHNRKGIPTDKQAVFILGMYERALRKNELIEAERANEVVKDKVVVTEGKVTISGPVVSMKFKDTDFGRVLKIVVKDERGFAVWGTMPKLGIDWNNFDEIMGKKLSFTADVTKSPNDPFFGFFKRPRKAVLVGVS